MNRLRLGGTLLGEGKPDEQRRARLELQQAKWAQGIIAKWDEIPRSQLVFSRYWIEHTETGNLYRESFGDPGYASNVCAYYVLADGSPVMLEPHDPPSLAEIERRRAAREQRRADQAAAAKARYDELRKTARR